MTAYVYRGRGTLAATEATLRATNIARITAARKGSPVDHDQLAIDTRNILRVLCAAQMRDVLAMRANASHPRACCQVCGALHRAAIPCDICALRAEKEAA